MQHAGALGQTPRHGQDQRHGHVGGVLGEDARRVGHGDAALDRGGDVDVVDAVAEVGDQLQLPAGLAERGTVDLIGHRRHDDIGGLGGLDEFPWVIGLSSGLKRASNNSRMRVSTLSGSWRVTTTSGFLPCAIDAATWTLPLRCHPTTVCRDCLFRSP